MHQPSEFISLLRSKVLIHKTDLESATSDNVTDVVSKSNEQYCATQLILLTQVYMCISK